MDTIETNPRGAVPPPANGYAPLVGDCFHKPPATHTNTLTGKTWTAPESRAEVTMTDGRHVVCVINGLEYTMPMKQFVYLAEKTLANGATLRRAGHSGDLSNGGKAI